MARPVPQGQSWQSPAAETNKAPALEPVDLPPAIEQGVDMIYIDEDLVPRAVHDDASPGMSFAAWSGAPVDLFTSVNPIYTELRRGLVKYHDDPDSAFRGWNDAWLSPQFRAWNIEADIAKVSCPVLAVQGVDDEYGTLEQIRAVARHVPQTELLVLSHCGHSPHRDQPERLIREAGAFIVDRS